MDTGFRSNFLNSLECNLKGASDCVNIYYSSKDPQISTILSYVGSVLGYCYIKKIHEMCNVELENINTHWCSTSGNLSVSMEILIFFWESQPQIYSRPNLVFLRHIFVNVLTLPQFSPCTHFLYKVGSISSIVHFTVFKLFFIGSGVLNSYTRKKPSIFF